MKILKRTEETLVLTRDVENPKPDRRFKRDWTKEPVWEKGTKFIVTTELRERTVMLNALKDAEELVSRTESAGVEIPADVTKELEILRRMDLSPMEYQYIQKRGTYDRIQNYDEEAFEALMGALKPAKRDLKDLLGDYADDSWGGPIVVLQQLLDNGTLSPKQIELAVAQLDPDHTPLDSIVMATADEVTE